MFILAYNTISDVLSLALLKKEQETLVSYQEKVSGGHAAILVPKLQEFLAREKSTFEEVDVFSICVGPGSFTGTRIACALALGLATSRNTPVLGISAFQMHAAYMHEHILEKNMPCLIVLKSGAEFCVQAIGPNLGPFGGVFEKPLCLKKEELFDLLQSDTTSYVLGGDGVCFFEECEEPVFKYSEDAEQIIWAEYIAKAALRLMNQGFYPPPTPLYVRPAYVQVPE